MKQFCLAGVVALAGALGIVGCGEEPGTKEQISVGNAAPVTALPPTSAIALEPRYEATPAEGIDFKKRGFPNFLTEVSGMSGYEPWGRWGMGPSTIFTFKEKLPEHFKITLVADILWPNQNKPILVKVGNVVQEFRINQQQGQQYTLNFKNHGGQKSIEFVVSKPVVPKEAGINGDIRPLSIGFISMKIEQQ